MADEPEGTAAAVAPAPTDTVSRTEHNKLAEKFRKLDGEHKAMLATHADLVGRFDRLSALSVGLQQHANERDALKLEVAELKKAAGGDITDLQARATASDEWKAKYEAAISQQPIDLILASAGVDDGPVRDLVRAEYEGIDEEGRPAFDAWWTEFQKTAPKYLQPYLQGAPAAPPADVPSAAAPAADAPPAAAAPAPAPGNEGVVTPPPLATTKTWKDAANFKSAATDPAQRKADWEAEREALIKAL